MWNNPRALDLVSAALVAVAVGLLVLAGLFWVSQRPMFTLRQIQIEPASGKLRHVSVATVRAASDALARDIVSFGGTVLDAPRDYPEYAPGYYAVFFADPDGIKLELVHLPA